MLLVFLCRHSMRADRKTPANIIVKSLQVKGIATIGTLQDLSAQHQRNSNERMWVLFLNDCRSSCLKVIAARFDADECLYINVDRDTTENEILDRAMKKWKFNFSLNS